MDASASQTGLPTRPVLPTGQHIYDSLMGGIEPELVEPVLSSLEQKYAAETPEQKAERMARYQKAFEEYDKQYAAYIVTLSDQVHTYRHESIKAVESRARADESAELSQLESTFSA